MCVSIYNIAEKQKVCLDGGKKDYKHDGGKHNELNKLIWISEWNSKLNNT